MASKRITGWNWKQNKNNGDWEAHDGPVSLEVWETNEGDPAWLWAVDIGGTPPCAPSESLALYGPPAKTAEQAMARAEARLTKFVESLVKRFSVRKPRKTTKKPAPPKPRKAVKK